MANRTAISHEKWPFSIDTSSHKHGGCRRDPGSLSHSPLSPQRVPHRHAALPVVKDKLTGHSPQEQDDGQVELELLILVLVGKSMATDMPGKGRVIVTTFMVV